MLRKLLYCSVFTLLCTSFDLLSQNVAPELSAALCEMSCWESPDRAERDSLLAAKAAFLIEANDPGRAFETISRIPSYGISPEQRAELIRLKLRYAYEAEMIDQFEALLEEAYISGALEKVELGTKPHLKSEDAAMLLSVIPGAGLAYAGDWSNAAKYFFLDGAIIASGVYAFTSGLTLTALLGGGLLLYATLPRSTTLSITAAHTRNTRTLLIYYTPLYRSLTE